MTHLDLFNGMFELVGAAFTWQNVRRLHRDKVVRGVDYRVTAFWSAWGFWNLYYYGSLGHMLSLVAGVVLALGNLVWVMLAVRYK